MFFYTTHLGQLAFPAKMQTLSAWISNLDSQGVPAKTIKSYFTGIRSDQIDIGLADLEVFPHPILHRIITGIK